ncbi:E3 ubiquitin-protein ligase MIB2-like [Mizuhopecten yessoensis]|uniref:RING-type E3 ubiquitin transferase n=1 Tax=Mizuhopecten yessoensis TaxID=6573 RepID=A0A210PKY6_MIZYE|nr:E3 ubiquitin-protein ligase MIB2-like [Mizuhopecten yessoensis]OWF37152.1 E3 ubiquitin-protein ligase MIB2 [Mizuhopecten yessoensis]
MSIIRPYKGSRVIRGQDWAYGNQDGGIGHIGTVVETDPESQVCSVLWDYGILMENCRAGDEGIDLRVVDTESSDFEYNLQHANCDTCVTVGPETKSISGYRWKCVECTDFDMCNLCYMQGKHDTAHHFMRYDNKLATVVPVPPRKRSRRLKVYSVMSGAQVKRSRRKGTDSEIGVIKTVTKIVQNQEIVVEWKSGETTTHLSGPNCKFDLVSAHPTVTVYIDHLPQADFNKIPDTWINVGDTVMIDLNIDTFKCLQKEYGGWNETMEKIMGELGTVNEVNTLKFKVYYPVAERTWHVCSNACIKISIAEAGDKVKVLENQAMVQERQNRHGGWRETMKDIIGKVGEVERVDSSGDLTVTFTSGIHLLNPSCCIKVMTSSQLPKKASDTDAEPKHTRKVDEKSADMSNMQTKTQTEEIKEKERGEILNEVKEESTQRTDTDKTHIIVVGEREQDTDSNKESLEDEDEDDDEDDGVDFLQWLINTEYEEMMDPGVRVVRGKDWKWGEQDGGEGNVGTVIDVGTQEDGSCPQRCAIVQWDSGYRNTYRAGFEDSFDLRIFDTATIGIRHPSVVCSVCEESDLMGFIWRCESNPDIILCNTCYHGDKNDVKLHFLRINKPGDAGVRANKREMSKKVTAKGVFEGARVSRGPDWMWEDQDGNGNGIVIAVVNFSLDTDRDAVEVTWDIGPSNVYRHGYDGKLDLKCIKVVPGGTYYRDQLPDLKINLNTTPAAPTASVSEAGSERLIAGDAVRIGVDPEVLQAIHKSAQGMWNDSMIDCIGKIGEVVVQSGEDVTVKFDIGSWTFKEMALDKVKQLKKGEIVRVRDNEQEVKELQNGHGNWDSQIQKTLGKKGKVHSIDRYGDVTLTFGSVRLQFNPAVLDPADGEPDTLSDEKPPKARDGDPNTLSDEKPPKARDIPVSSVKLPSQSPVAAEKTTPVTHQDTKSTAQLLAELEEVVRDGYADRVKTMLEEHIHLRDMGKPPLIITACELGHTDVVKELVNANCNLEVRNDKDSSKSDPLLTAVRKKYPDVVEVLLNAGVKKTVTNSHGQTAVHIAVQERDIKMLTLLQKHKLDINRKDNLGDSAITDAISTGDKRFIDIVVDWQGVQLNYFNRLSFSPLHFAARKGDNYAIRKILQKDPGLVNIPKSDGFTALHLAACQDHVGIVQFLVGMPSVDREAKTSKGLTPLHVAALHGSVKTINLFLGLEDGTEPISSTQPVVDLDSLDDKGNNALHFCLRGEDADVQQQSLPSEETVQRQIEIALKLIHRGVKYNTRNLDGKAPLDECTNELVKERIRTALQEKDVRHKVQPVAPPSNLCMSCDEDQASYQLEPCYCKICVECGGRKAKKCPNCSCEVQTRVKL